MAKRIKVNKTVLVQDYLAKHPNAGPAEVAKSLKEHMISAAYVSSIKTRLKRGTRNKVRKLKGPSTRKLYASVDENVIAAARFIKSCGGVEEAAEAFGIAQKVARALQ